MNRLGGQAAPWWLILQLWGLDAPLAACCWSLAFAVLMDIPMITTAPFLLLAAVVWFITISSRLYGAVRQRKGWYMLFYRENFALLLLLTLTVAALSLWGLFCYEGQLFLHYAYQPLFLTLLGVLPVINRHERLRSIVHALAFAWACAVPPAYISVVVSAHDFCTSAAVWYFTILMYLYYLVRGSWRMEEDAARKRGLAVSVSLGLLFFFCLLSGGSLPPFERSLCLIIAIAALFLELLVRLRPRLSQDALFALGWLAMALPPLLGMWLFG